MVVLDTNVVSELMKAAPRPSVKLWLAAQRRPTVFISAITEAGCAWASPYCRVAAAGEPNS